MSDNYEKVIEKENVIELLESSNDSSVLEVVTKSHAASSTSTKKDDDEVFGKSIFSNVKQAIDNNNQFVCFESNDSSVVEVWMKGSGASSKPSNECGDEIVDKGLFSNMKEAMIKNKMANAHSSSFARFERIEKPSMPTVSDVGMKSLKSECLEVQRFHENAKALDCGDSYENGFFGRMLDSKNEVACSKSNDSSVLEVWTKGACASSASSKVDGFKEVKKSIFSNVIQSSNEQNKMKMHSIADAPSDREAKRSLQSLNKDGRKRLKSQYFEVARFPEKIKAFEYGDSYEGGVFLPNNR